MKMPSEPQTLQSVLCTTDDWTPSDTTNWTSIAFRPDGVGCLKILPDGPGTLLVCEFEWKFNDDFDNDAARSPAMVVDTQQTDLADTLRTRVVATFPIDIKFRNRQPRDEFGVGSSLDMQEANSRRLKATAYDEAETFFMRLEVGNFPPQHDSNPPDSASYGRTRWGLRLSFLNKSPIPPADKWHDRWHGMLEGMNWDVETNWFSRRLLF